MNNNDEIFRHDERRDASRMRKWSEESEWLLRKTSNEIKRGDQKVEKNGREDERHDRKKYLNKDDRQTIENCDLDVFSARDRRFLETKIK